MFTLAGFIHQCRAAAASPKPRAALTALLREAVAEPDLWAQHLHTIQGADDRGVAPLFTDASLSVIHVDLAPGFASRIHSHGLWAAIGVYEGQEDNVLYRAEGEGVIEVGRQPVRAGEVVQLGSDAIHAIGNPLDRPLRALHVYDGDLPAAWRHRWASLDGPAVGEGAAAQDRSG
jgi:predicted metal-dependent enzyme (double-stranded beta helix superfamily)